MKLFNKWHESATEWIRQYREKRFLKRHGCQSMEHYNRLFDPDVQFGAVSVNDFYHGYPCLVPVEPNKIIDLAFYGRHRYHTQMQEMMDWCKQNCKGKWRQDWHRGWWGPRGVYEFNSIGGGDMLFFAFKEEVDYVWFKLTWE